MSNLPVQTSPVYCTDEDIAVRAGGDYFLLAPAWQQMAAGTDGVITGGSPWVLTSAAQVNFATNNVSPNQVVQLSAPKTNFPGSGQFLAVDSVSGASITLRRLHQDLNVGQPPALAGVTGVTFTINTLGPQIEEASWDIKQRFGIDENVFYRSSSYIYVLRELRIATVLNVLKQRYAAEVRVERGDWSYKFNLIRSELDQTLDRIRVLWGQFGNSAEPSTVFNTKICR
jgi:hypothetical protein